MELLRISDGNSISPLYDYWWEKVQHVPYCFDTSLAAWSRCLLDDREAGEPLFAESHVDVAVDNAAIVGFVQYGKPSYHYDEKGERYSNPEIGVIRHLYFDPHRLDAGKALLARAESYCSRFEECFAFYHAFGMGCQAYHGKLHERMTHVASLLSQQGFTVRHENVYYVLPVSRCGSQPTENLDIRVKRADCRSVETFSLYLGDHLVGSAVIRYLKDLTGGVTANVAYLTWIAIEKDLRRVGLGRRLISRVIDRVSVQGCEYLHTDTAITNHGAQRFYEMVGFQNRGVTRDYVRR